MGFDIPLLYKMSLLGSSKQGVENMSYWNSAWTRFMGANEEVQSMYQEPERDTYGNLSCIDTMMSSLCFNFSRMVQSQINEALHAKEMKLQISADIYMQDLLSSLKKDWKAATLLIIRVELMHLADQLTPIHPHCAPKRYQQMQLDRANFETDHASAIHDKIHDVFTELIHITLNQHNLDSFEHKQERAWQYFQWACSSGEYGCGRYDIQRILMQMPHWLV